MCSSDINLLCCPLCPRCMCVCAARHPPVPAGRAAPIGRYVLSAGKPSTMLCRPAGSLLSDPEQCMSSCGARPSRTHRLLAFEAVASDRLFVAVTAPCRRCGGLASFCASGWSRRCRLISWCWRRWRLRRCWGAGRWGGCMRLVVMDYCCRLPLPSRAAGQAVPTLPLCSPHPPFPPPAWPAGLCGGGHQGGGGGTAAATAAAEGRPSGGAFWHCHR
jgi:hypothetical protein